MSDKMDKEQRARIMREKAKEYLESINAERTIDQVYEKKYDDKLEKEMRDNTLDHIRNRMIKEALKSTQESTATSSQPSASSSQPVETSTSAIINGEEEKIANEDRIIDGLIADMPDWELLRAAPVSDNNEKTANHRLFRHVSTGCVRKRIQKISSTEKGHYANTMTPRLPKYWKILKDPFDNDNENKLDSDALYYWNIKTNVVQRERPREEDEPEYASDGIVQHDVKQEILTEATHKEEIASINTSIEHEKEKRHGLVLSNIEIKQVSKKRKLLE